MVVLMPRSMWTKQSPTDFTPPDRILTTISGDGGPGRWEFRGLSTDEDYRVFVIPGLAPEMVYGPAFYELLSGSSLLVPGNTNSCPDYRRSVPESDPFLLSRCEVMAPADDLILEARDRMFR